MIHEPLEIELHDLVEDLRSHLGLKHTHEETWLGVIRETHRIASITCSAGVAEDWDSLSSSHTCGV